MCPFFAQNVNLVIQRKMLTIHMDALADTTILQLKQQLSRK